MNKKSAVPVIVIVVAIVGIIIALKMHNDSKVVNNTPKVSTTQSDTTPAAVSPGFYLSSVYNIYFLYPNKYVLDEKDAVVAGEKRHTLTLITASDRQLISLASDANATPGDIAPESITVDIFPGAAASKTVDAWVRTSSNSNFKLSHDHVLSPTTISGLPAVTYSWDGLLSNNSVVVAYKGSVIVINMSYISSQDVVWQDFAKVVQSFKVKN